MSTDCTVPSRPSRSPQPMGKSYVDTDIEENDSAPFRPSFQTVPRNSVASSIGSAISLFSSRVIHPSKWWANTMEDGLEYNEEVIPEEAKENLIDSKTASVNYKAPLCKEDIDGEIMNDLVELASKQQQALGEHRQRMVELQNQLDEEYLTNLISGKHIPNRYSLPNNCTGEVVRASCALASKSMLGKAEDEMNVQESLITHTSMQPVTMMPTTNRLTEPRLLLDRPCSNMSRKPSEGRVSRKSEFIASIGKNTMTEGEWSLCMIKLLPKNALTDNVIKTELTKESHARDMADAEHTPITCTQATTVLAAKPKSTKKKLREQKAKVATLLHNFGDKVRRR